jgi:hypothetical protein
MNPNLTIRTVVRYMPYVLAVLLLSAAGGFSYADKGAQHQTEQTRPSYFGVSGSNINFLDVGGNSYCYAGTLGALVTDGSKNYILSNNHVLAKENSASNGESVIQPGLLDENGDPNSCSPPRTDYSPYIVGKLSYSVQIKFDGSANYVDAAIAQVNTDCTDPLGTTNVSCMDPNGRILDIGGLSGNTVFSGDIDIQTLIGLAVQKSGRTTGLTTGTVGAVGVNVDVNYDSGTAHFEDQLLVSGDKGAFIKAGDSGSLVVIRPTGSTLPQAVGLLFAGSVNGVAIANRIDRVLNELHVSMVQCSTDCSNTGVVSGGGSGGGGGGSHGGGGGGSHGPSKGSLGSRVASGLDFAAEVRDRHEPDLMGNPDVVGTGLSLNENGDPVIQVYTRGSRRLVGQSIPSELEGVKVRVIVTGEFRAN